MFGLVAGIGMPDIVSAAFLPKPWAPKNLDMGVPYSGEKSVISPQSSKWNSVRGIPLSGFRSVMPLHPFMFRLVSFLPRDELLEVISKVNMLTLNDSEARLLTGEYHLRRCAGMILDMGPQYVVIKKGEHGAMLFSRSGIFIVPAYPVDMVVDPTGAGDSFAGGFMGVLAAAGRVDETLMRNALLHGSVVASLGVEGFSLDRLRRVTVEQIEGRMKELRKMMQA